MQFDQTNIVVRERGMLEILDLSLHALRHHFRPLVIMWLIGVVPMMILNHLIVGSLLDTVEFDGDLYLGEYGAWIYYYNYLMTLLIFVEGQLATSFMTKYMGEAVFQQSPKLRTQIKSVLKSAWPIIWTQCVLRCVLIVWALVYFYGVSDTTGGSGLSLFLILVVHCLIRATRPYITEIILLEKNPLRSDNPNEITAGRRSRSLHTAGGTGAGIAFGRTVVGFLFGMMLTYAVYGGFIFLSGVLWNDWEQGSILIQIGFPVAMWIVVGYLAVARFLCYLDTRIRFEGWEVELRLRAEAGRIRGKVAKAN